ncbi:MAG: acetyltransferase [Verrucomicrobiales bacterium]|nr:acetyltransferase [Verrucomicrobiales bacterium]
MSPRRIVVFAALLFCLLAAPARSIAAPYGVEESGGAGDYVVLVHGLDWFRDTLKPTADFLNRQGFHTINVRYPSRKIACTSEAVEWVGKVVARRCTDPRRRIHFVAHSMGTVVVREYLAKGRPGQLGHVVLLAAPNRGTPLASSLRWKPLGRIICPAASGLGCGKKGAPLTEPVAVDFAPGILMGNRAGWFPYFSPFLPGPDDGVVPVSSGQLPGMAEMRVLPTSHTGMPRNAGTLSETLSFIRTGRFSPEPLR